MFFLSILFPKNTLALEATIGSINPQLVQSKDQEIEINISITDLPSGDSYFRIGVESGSSTVGYMKDNDGIWHKLDTLINDKSNNTCNKYLGISTDGSYTLYYKIGDDNDIQNGERDLKLYRFTSTCGTATFLADYSIEIALPTPTPTPSPSPTSQPTDEPDPTITSTPVPTKSATPKPTKSPTPKPTSTPTLTPTSTPVATDSEQDLLVIADLEGQSNSTPQGVVAGAFTKKVPVLSYVFILSGVAFLMYGGYSLYNKSRAEKIT